MVPSLQQIRWLSLTNWEVTTGTGTTSFSGRLILSDEGFFGETGKTSHPNLGPRRSAERVFTD